MKKLALWIVASFFLISTMQQVFAASVLVGDLYSAPSEGEVYSGATNSSCQRLDTNCQDTQFPTVVDAYTLIGDGSTAGTSAFTIRNSSNTQSSYLRLVYDLDQVYSGDYQLRIGYTSGVTANSLIVCEYVNHTAVNTSGCLNYTHPSSEVWSEHLIDDLVRRSAERFGDRVILRVQVRATSQYISEAYIKRPLAPDDFSIVSQGVSETEANTRVANSWTIYSIVDVPDITGGSCNINKLLTVNDSDVYVRLNNSDLNMSFFVYNQGPTAEFTVFWNANTSKNGIDEGYNYLVNCSGYLGDLYMQGFNQYVYVNNQQTILDYIRQFVIYVQQMLGLLNKIEASVVANLQLGTGMRYTGETSDIIGKLTYAGETVETNSTCNLTAYYPNMTKWIDNQQMSHFENGIYNYTVTWPWEKGPYTVDGHCYGGNISKETFDTVQIDVLDGVVMRSIT